MRVRIPARLIAMAVAVAVVSAACIASQTQTPIPVTIRIAGSTSLQLVLEELAAAYQAAHPNVLMDIRGGGTAIGVQQLHDAQIDLAAISWQAEDEKLPDGVQAIPIARDGIAVIVHPINTLNNVTSLQLQALYRGETLDWATLGNGSGMPTVISREEGSGTRAAFEALVMEGQRVTLNALVLPTSRAVVDYVAAHRNAIGYVSSGALTDAVHLVPVEEIAPTTTMLRTGVYRLGRVLYLYTASPAPVETQAFLDFVLSPAGQAIIARHLIPVR